MSTKSKRRAIRRSKQDETSRTARSSKVPRAERQVIGGEIVGALLSAITFGAIEPAPQSRA